MSLKRQIVIRIAKGSDMLDAFLQHFIIICIVYNGTTTWKYIANGPVVTGRVGYAFLGVLAAIASIVYVVCSYTFQRIGINKTGLQRLLCVSVYNLLYIVLSRYGVSGFILGFLLSLLSFVLLIVVLRNNKKLDQFFLRFSNVVYILAIISLVAYFLGGILDVIPAKDVLLVRNGYNYFIRSYFGMTYIGQTGVFLGYDVLRNTGIFLEAPGWVVPLTIAAYVEFFLRKKRNRVRIFILVLTTITTFSTKGIIAIMFLFLADFFRDPKNRTGTINAIKKLLFPVVGVVFLVFVYYLIQRKSVEGSISYTHRMEDAIVAFKVWLKYIFLGCGFGNLTPFESYLSIQSTSSITNGVLKMFAQCGLFIGGEVLFFASQIYYGAKKEVKYSRACLLGIYFFYLFGSSTWTNSMLMLILAIGCSQFCEKSIEPNDK